MRYSCRCHAHGIGHAPATITLVTDGIPKLCKDCYTNGCDADRPLPDPLLSLVNFAQLHSPPDRDLEKILLFGERYGTRLQDGILINLDHYTSEEIDTILLWSKLPESFKEWVKSMDGINVEHEHMEAPETVLVFAKEADDSSGTIVEIVREPPLAEELEYYKAYKVPKAVWEKFNQATHELEVAKYQAEKALKIHQETFAILNDALCR